MGTNTLTYQRPISVSPQASYTVSNFESVNPIIQAQPNITSTPPSSSGRVMYPSSTYTYGNPGYYYDPMQFPVSHDTQTSPNLYALQQNTCVPIRNNSLSMNVTTSTGDISSQRALFDANLCQMLPFLLVMIHQHMTFFFILKKRQIMIALLIRLMSDQHPQNINGESSPYQHQLHHHDAGCQVSLCENDLDFFFPKASRLTHQM
jgi:hypothetical protein